VLLLGLLPCQGQQELQQQQQQLQERQQQQLQQQQQEEQQQQQHQQRQQQELQSCWEGDFNWVFCCSPTFGPGGNPACWDGGSFNF
ncbi:unnamed protein product, partial [Polarella glacialis]